MSDYTRITNFTIKDSLTTGDPEKLISGQEIQAELDAISVAIASKPDPTDVTAEIDAAIEDAVLNGIAVSADAVTAADSDTTAAQSVAPATNTTLATVTLPVAAAGDCFRITTYVRSIFFSDNTGTVQFSATIGGTAFAGPGSYVGPKFSAGGGNLPVDLAYRLELLVYVVSTSSQKVVFSSIDNPVNAITSSTVLINSCMHCSFSKDTTTTNDVLIRATTTDNADVEHILTIMEKIEAV